MPADREVEAMSTISEALSSVEDNDARARILNWARERFLPKSAAAAPGSGFLESESGTSGPVPTSVGPKASRWLRQSGLTQEEVEQVFHIDGDGVSIIAATIPGKHAGEQVVNCYLLEGARNLLANDKAVIDDVAARELCRNAGCYDATNHSKRVAKFENRITGDASRGWTLTGPGQSAAAALVKQIAMP